MNVKMYFGQVVRKTGRPQVANGPEWQWSLGACVPPGAGACAKERERKVLQMDYSKMGGARSGSNKPRHKEHNEPGTKKTPYGKKPVKADLLERMKQAAEKKAK